MICISTLPRSISKSHSRRDTIDTDTSLCGPPGYILDTISQLASLGVPSDRIHYELFSAGSPS